MFLLLLCAFALAISLPVQGSSCWFSVAPEPLSSRKLGCLINIEPDEDPEEVQQVSLLPSLGEEGDIKLGQGKQGSSGPQESLVSQQPSAEVHSCFSPSHWTYRGHSDLPCHTIWTILRLPLVNYCSTISCRGDLLYALGFLYKKKNKDTSM